MSRKRTAYFAFALSLLLLVSGPAWAQNGSQSDLDQLHDDRNEVEFTTLSDSLESLDLADRMNAVIQLEMFCDMTPELRQKTETIENLWNTGNFDRALAALRLWERSGGAPGAVGINWRIPKTTQGLTRGDGDDTIVDWRGDAEGVHLAVHEATGNLFTVIQRGSGNTELWTVHMSTNGGLSWTETGLWGASQIQEIQDVSIAIGRDMFLNEYLYVAYVAHDGVDDFSLARFRRVSTVDGTMDTGFGYIEVFDKGVEIEEVALISEIDYGGVNLWYFAILADSSLVCYVSPDGGNFWNENVTGITAAFNGLDAVDLDGSPFTLAVSYCSGPFASLALRSTTSWVTITLDTMMPVSPTAISAWDDNIVVVYTDVTATCLRYSASDNGGNSWTSGDIATSMFPVIHSFDVTARMDDGISVVYQEETGDSDTCWHTHCDYGIYDFSPPEPFNELDVNTGSDICIERLPSLSGTPEYGMLWIHGDTKRVFFDRVDMVVEALSVDNYAIYASAGGGTVNFTLDAGSAYANRGYYLLGSTSGTEPGTPLPGGMATLPLNWDGFSSLVRNNMNSSTFSDFNWYLDYTGKGAAQLNATVVPPTYVGLSVHFAFCLHSPYDYASNPVEIRILP